MAKGDIVRLENWSISAKPNSPYHAPELWMPLLFGEAFGHSKFPDGTMIQTSQLVKSEGRTVTTYSGSIYKLGSPDPYYVQWCEEHGIKIDEENPIKLPPA